MPAGLHYAKQSICHILGLGPPKMGPVMLKFELGQDFGIQCTYPASFISLCLIIQKLSCLQTNKYTNKEILSKTSTSLCYSTLLEDSASN